ERGGSHIQEVLVSVYRLRSPSVACSYYSHNTHGLLDRRHSDFGHTNRNKHNATSRNFNTNGTDNRSHYTVYTARDNHCRDRHCETNNHRVYKYRNSSNYTLFIYTRT
ncbi:hypothetical protein NFI96_025466, partial [Prochilodus magdalenae]